MALNFQAIYVLGSGGERTFEQLNTITNNLANVNTSGFKKLLLKEMSQKIPENIGQKRELLVFPRFEDTPVVLTQGSLRRTDNKFDLAIEGEGFFMVKTPDGIKLTRNGHFKLSNDGFLTDINGFKVLNKDKTPIKINPDAKLDFYINREGQIFQGNEHIGDLGIVNYEKVKPVGYTYYEPDGLSKEPDFSILQGFLENSNVNPVESMVELINSHRRMEIYSNLMKSLDNLEQKTNEIGKA